MVDTIKFSEFIDGGDLEPNQITAGLENNQNTIFSNPFPLLPPGSTAERPAPAPAMYFRLRFNTTLQSYEYYSSVAMDWVQLEDSIDVQTFPFVIYTDEPLLPSAFNLGSLTNGILKQSVLAGVATPAIALNGTDYYGPGYTGYLVSPSGIADESLNPILNTISAGPTSVNYIQISNNTAGFNPIIMGQGSDPNVGITFSTLGNGDLVFDPSGTGKTVVQSDMVVPVNSFVYFPTGDIAFQISQTAVPPGTAYLIFRNSLASGGSIEAGGSNANVNIQLVPKGAAQVIISGNTDTAGKLLLRENSANGLDSFSIKAAEDMSNTYVLTYPSAAPTISSSILISSTGGALSWTNFEENVAFNPVPQGSTTPGSPTGTFTGRYNRHGRRVWGDMRLNFTAITGMVGNLIVDGFPYPVASGSENRASVAIGFRNNFTNDFVLIGYLGEGTTILNLWNGSVDGTRLVIGDLSATTQFYVTFSYTAN